MDDERSGLLALLVGAVMGLLCGAFWRELIGLLGGC